VVPRINTEHNLQVADTQADCFLINEPPKDKASIQIDPAGELDLPDFGGNQHAVKLSTTSLTMDANKTTQHTQPAA